MSKQEGGNDAVFKYLRYYCAPDTKVDFAVMVRGKWGAGKTHLIEQFLAERKNAGQTKNLYVSLYGLNSFRQVDQALYRQLHPILSSKGMKLLASLGKSVLKATTRLEFDSGKDEVTIEASIPDVDLSEYFKTPKDCLLVFDDLERCAMAIPDIMGYINSFVEHEEFKVIIIANEEDLAAGDEKYKRIKEKLIGQTLTVQALAASALDSFIALIRDERTKDYLISHRADIELIHGQSATENLRLLKHALWDFERLCRCFSADHWAKTEAVGILFRNVLAFSYETRSGRLKEQQLLSVAADASLRLFKKETDSGPADDLKARYPEVEFEQTILSSEAIRKLLFDGWLDCASIVQMLNDSPYYASPATLPAWKVAWHAWEISDEEFEEAVLKVEQQFRNREFNALGELFHVFGLRLFFSDVRVIDKSRDDVVGDCKAYLDDIYKSGHFPDPLVDRQERFIASEGIGYAEANTPEFKVIVKYFDERSAALLKETLPARGLELLQIMEQDVQDFFRRLCLNNVTSSPFFEIPVLAYVRPQEFVERLLVLSPAAQRSVFVMFRGRYERGELVGSLKEEKPWLVKVKQNLESRMASMRPMTRYRMRSLLARNLDPFLALGGQQRVEATHDSSDTESG